MITTKQIEEIVSQYIADSGIFIVEVNVSPGNNINVRIDHPQGITIDTCAHISRQIESNLNRDVEDFSLEVASAGIGQPFLVRKQYEKVVGKKIELVLKNGRKCIETLQKVEDDGITVSQSPTKFSKKALKTLPAEEQELIRTEQNTNIKLTWEEIKSATEHINFQ
jgi:ribosome maturation factor RimP